MRYLCVYEDGNKKYLGLGDTLIEAFADLDLDFSGIVPDDCLYYRVGLSPLRIKVETTWTITERE